MPTAIRKARSGGRSGQLKRYGRRNPRSGRWATPGIIRNAEKNISQDQGGSLPAKAPPPGPGAHFPPTSCAVQHSLALPGFPAFPAMYSKSNSSLLGLG